MEKKLESLRFRVIVGGFPPKNGDSNGKDIGT